MRFVPDPVGTVVTLTLAVGYAAGVLRARAAFGSWPAARIACLTVGVLRRRRSGTVTQPLPSGATGWTPPGGSSTRRCSRGHGRRRSAEARAARERRGR